MDRQQHSQAVQDEMLGPEREGERALADVRAGQPVGPFAGRPHFWQPWLGSVVAIGIATLIFFLLVIVIQVDFISLPLGVLAEDGGNPYVFGVAFQDSVPALALLIVIAATRVFQRWVLGTGGSTDRTLLFSMFVGAELLYLLYRESFVDGGLPYALLIVAVAGLYGGWRFGLSLGLISTLVRGLIHIFFEITEYSPNLFADVQFWDIFEWFYLSSIPTIAPIWVGFVAGHAGKLMGTRRYMPLWLILLSIYLHFFPSFFTFLVWDDPYQIEIFPAVLTIFGLSIAAFGLLTSNIRGTAAQRQAETARLQLSQAELRALRAQINPHFLFNSLNTIRYFVRTDPEVARRLLLDLSEVFQVALKAGDFVTLEDEIDFTKSYLALEQARLGERLAVHWFVQSDDLLDESIPTLLLQPIVENGIVHGIAPKMDGGRIEIMVTRGVDQVVLQVIDDGVGMSAERLTTVADPNSAPEGSIGTYNIQNRLRSLYGERASYRIESTKGKGTLVEVRVPLQKN